MNLMTLTKTRLVVEDALTSSNRATCKLVLLAVLAMQASNAWSQLSAPKLAIGNDQSSASLSWPAVDGATGYRLLYAPYPYLGEESLMVADLGATRAIEGELPNGSAYLVAVEAYSDTEISEYSNVEHFIVNDAHLAYTSDAGSHNGLTLIAPMSSDIVYLIDDFGDAKHQWQTSSSPALSAYLQSDGSLLKTGQVQTDFFDAGGKGGLIEELDWDGNVLWQFEYSDQNKSLHHDIEPLPNGNVLAVTWEDRGDIWSEVLIEIEKSGSTGGNIVWQWDVFDHLDELGLDPDDARTEDWIHINSIDYNQASNQILVSSRSHDQLWIINKDDGSVAAISSVSLSGQHDGKWIDDTQADSNITVFDNGSSFSRSLELDPAMQNILFSYGNNDSEFFYSERISGTQRLKNGNTLICSGVNGLIIEVDARGEQVREYTNTFGGSSPRGQQTSIFRAEKYPSGYTPYF